MSMPTATPPGYAPQPQPQQPVVVPRWGYQASFIQRRQPAFWLFVILLAITGVVVLGRELEFIQVRPTAWFFSIPLLIIYVAPLLIAIYVLDLFEREPLGLLVAAFLWGGIVAIGFSGMTNTAWLQIIQKVMGPDFARDWGPALIGPSVEETLKGLGVVVLFLVARAEFDDVFDGFVYGAVVGLGFAAVEDLHYFVRLSEANDQIGGVLYLYWIRVISAGLYGHVLYTGLVGMGFAYFVSRRDQPYARRVQVGLGAFGLAWLAHFIWNSPIFSFLIGNGSLVNWFVTATVKGLPIFLVFAFLVYLAQKREARWFAYATARETGTDLLSSDEVRQLSDLRSRRAARKAVGARKGPAAEKLMGRLQREQINLAMVRTRVDHEEHPDLVRQRAMIRAIRTELAAIPDLPPPVAMPGYAPGTAPGAGPGALPGQPGGGPTGPAPSHTHPTAPWSQGGAAPGAGSTSASGATPGAGATWTGGQAPGSATTPATGSTPWSQPGTQPPWSSAGGQPSPSATAQPWTQAGLPATPSGPTSEPAAAPTVPPESIWATPASGQPAGAAPAEPEHEAPVAAPEEVIELGPGATAPTEAAEPAGGSDEPGAASPERETERLAVEPSLEPTESIAEQRAAGPEPAAEAVEPEPAGEAVEPEPAAVEPEPEPAAEAVEPEPAADAVEPEPAGEAVEPEPAAEAVEPEPEAEPGPAGEPETAFEAFEPEPEPAAEAAAPEPAAEAVEPAPKPTIDQAEPAAREPGPAVAPADAQASAPQVRPTSSLFGSGPAAAGTGAAGASTGWQTQPTPTPQPSAAPVWAPTHLVPAGGMQAWATPDGSRPPIAMLAERLDLRVVERAADWARVVASNGWTGWVDGRRLVDIGG